MDPKTGQYDCKACEAAGNAWTFLEKHVGLSKAEAAKVLKKAAGVVDEPAEKKSPGLTVKQYALAKKIPEDELRAYGLSDSRGAVIMPYLDESGQCFSTRKRHSMSGAVKFSWVKGSKVGLYGLFKLREAKEAGYIVLVEGESDCHTLWHHGIPALGSPGADTFQSGWAKYLDGLKVYIHQEPDHGGEVFVKKVCRGLVEGQFRGNTFRMSIPGHKDPSALHLSAEDFTVKWKTAFDHAEPIDMRDESGLAEEIIPGQPFVPKKPDAWRYSESGIYKLDLKTGNEYQIAPMPILIAKRLYDIDQGTERLEIVFLRDGKWRTLYGLIGVRSTNVPKSRFWQTQDWPSQVKTPAILYPISSPWKRRTVTFCLWRAVFSDWGGLEIQNLFPVQLTRSSLTLMKNAR